MIRLKAAHQGHLESLAIAAYPRESCGVLVGRAGERAECLVERVIAVENVARASDRFELDPGGLVAADRAARADGLEIVGVWHSHADAPARPSSADVAGAYGGWRQVIASVVGGRVTELRGFRIQAGRVDEEEVCG